MRHAGVEFGVGFGKPFSQLLRCRSLADAGVSNVYPAVAHPPFLAQLSDERSVFIPVPDNGFLADLVRREGVRRRLGCFLRNKDGRKRTGAIEVFNQRGGMSIS